MTTTHTTPSPQAFRWGLLLGTLLTLGLFAPLSAGAASTSNPGQAASTASQKAGAAAPFKPLPGQSRTALPDGSWLFLGGQHNGKPVARALRYDPVTQQATVLPATLTQARYGHSATLLPDGSVLILGGYDASGVVRTAPESYDPVSHTLQALPPLDLHPRVEHRVTVLADGRLLITGGLGADGKTISEAEILNPFNAVVEHLIPEDTGRFRHLATLLPTHDVLLTQGHGANRQPLASAELYQTLNQRFTPLDPEGAAQAQRSLQDPRPPTLINSDPPNGAADVGIGQILVVRLSKAMDLRTLNTGTVTLLGVSGPVPIRVTPVEDGLLLFIWPHEQLRPANRYTLMIKGTTDLQGQALDFLTLSFKTAAVNNSVALGQASSLATANLSGSLALHQKADTLQASSDALGNDSEAWQPNLANYKGDWTSRRVFKHSRDYTHEQDRRHAFLDSLTPRARALIKSRWKNKGLLTTETRTQTPAQARLLKAGPGSQNSVAGQVLRLDGQPLSHVTLSMAGKSTQTDANGDFLLQDVPLGSQVLEIDGRSANRKNSTYGRFDYHMNVQAGANELDFTLWMPKLDTRNAVHLASPTTEAVTVGHPQLPGLELHIPAGTVIRDKDGKIVTEISITPVPVDQPPFPMPYVDVPVFFTIQPGGATLHATGAQPSSGAYISYPNYTQQEAGARVQLFDYDPKGRGWYTYTLGTVNDTRDAIIPDQPFKIYQFTTISSASPGDTPPAEKPDTCGGTDGDPVTCHEGLFLELNTDLALSDTLPLSVSRSYRQKDNNQRAFGVGTSGNLEQYLYFTSAGATYTASAIDLVSGNGGRVRFLPVNSNNYNDPNTYFQSSEPGPYYGAQLRITKTYGEFVITRRDGLRQGFSYYVSRLLWSEDRNGNRVSLFRDGSGRVTLAVSPNGRWFEFEYAAPNCSRCITTVSDNTGRSVNYTYNTKAQLTKVTDANGGITEYEYDTSNRMTAVKDPLGQVTGKHKVVNVYDANGRVQQQTYADGTTNLFAYTLDNGNVMATEVTHERGDIRRLTYDVAGKLLSDTQANGSAEQQTIRYVRNADGLPTEVTDNLGRVTRYEYDRFGNPTQVTKGYGTAGAVSWNMTYDPVFHQVATQTDPLGHITTYTYDTKGRLTRVEDPLKHKTELAYNDNGQLIRITRYRDAGAPLSTHLSYDGGDLTSITDPLGRTTKLQYDAAGRTTSVTDPLGRATISRYDPLDRLSSQTDPMGRQVSYTYDPNGNLLSFTDAQGQTTRWTYDPRNRPLSKQDALGQQERYSYDAGGNLTHFTDRKGQIRGHQYDLLNRITLTGFGATRSTTPDYQSTIRYTWDQGNRLTRIEDSQSGILTYRYQDPLDMLVEETGPAGSVAYTYTANGLRKSMTPSGGSPVSYTYDAANRLTGISQAAGSGSAQPGTAQQVSFTHDQSGRRTQVALPNGLRIAYTWDDASQLSDITYRKSDGSLIGNLSYGYDLAGQRIRQGGTLATTNLPPSSSAEYDPNNRLTAWKGTPFTYDANGNLTSDGKNTYTWDSRNQLIAINGAQSASFTYDSRGRRSSKTVGQSTTQYLYDGHNPVQESGSRGTANLLTGQGLDQWYGRTQNGTSLTYLPDALGSTLALSDTTQGLNARYTYEPYGKTQIEGNPGHNTFAYTGREEDGTGLYYYRARYYHPEISRFISEDPIGLNGGDNLYAYVDGNPISYSDPLGLWVTGFYDRSTGILTLTDRETGNSVSGSYESGGNPYGDPIPAGQYDILERQGRDGFYRLEPVDSNYGDDTHEETGRTNFRLHHPGRTVGCIAAQDDEIWNRTNSLIRSTYSDNVSVPSKSRNPWGPKTDTLRRFGRIEVIN